MNTTTIYKTIFSFISGCVAYWFGGYDLLLKTMLSLTCLDFVSGIVGAIRTKTFSARQCGVGISNKIFIYIVVALSVMVQRVTGDTIPLRETVIIFYIVYEGMSIIENVGKFVKYPNKLKEVFVKLQGGGDSE